MFADAVSSFGLSTIDRGIKSQQPAQNQRLPRSMQRALSCRGFQQAAPHADGFLADLRYNLQSGSRYFQPTAWDQFTLSLLVLLLLLFYAMKFPATAVFL